MSDLYGSADDAESIATIHAALDAGITLLDTGDFYGMGHNELLIRQEILPTCRALGIGITAYGVLSRGLISGHWSADRTTGPNDFRTYSPRFRPENLGHNLTLVDALRAIADAKGVDGCPTGDCVGVGAGQ